MGDTYKACIRLIINDFLPNHCNYEFKSNIDYLVNQSDTKGINFDPITVDDKPEAILVNLLSSIRNLRKNIVVDTTSKRMVQISIMVKRASYLSELEFKQCIAINCKVYATHEGTPLFNTVLDYIELFYDQIDAVDDLKGYLRMF